MTRYVTVKFVSRGMLAANARGESFGNNQTLQRIRTGDGEYTVLSAYAIPYAIRVAMIAMGYNAWRHVEADGTLSYGDARSASMMEGGKGVKRFDYDDIPLRGRMYTLTGSEAKAIKDRGLMQISPGISTGLYGGDVSFVQGKKENGDLCPFNFQRHYTRYQFNITFDLETLKQRPTAVEGALKALRGLQIGGSHTSNLSEFTPDLIAWRFHQVPGQSGLFLGMHQTRHWVPDKEIDTSVLTTAVPDIQCFTGAKVEEGFLKLWELIQQNWKD